MRQHRQSRNEQRRKEVLRESIELSKISEPTAPMHTHCLGLRGISILRFGPEINLLSLSAPEVNRFFYGFHST
jgi:hypothetical protein